MEIRQIRYAEEVARHRSFSRAAEAMFVTQQTLSQQIKRLEDEIGFEIFERSTRSVALTQRGNGFIKQALPLLQAWETFTQEIESLRSDTGQRIRLGILPTFSHLNILETIYDFQAKEKGISVEIQIQKSRQLVDMMQTGALNAAIGNLSQEQIDAMGEHYVIRVFSKDAICAILHRTHPLADREAIHLGELDGQTLLLLSKGSSIRNRMEAALSEWNITPTVVHDCLEMHSMVGILHSGVGIGFLSSQVALEYATGALKALPLLPEMETITALYYPKNSEKRQTLDLLTQFFSR